MKHLWRVAALLFFAAAAAVAQQCPQGYTLSGGNCVANNSGGGSTIPSVTNLISGNGSGNGADSGIPPTAILATGPTLFVCAKANGSTCVSTDTGNGWNGNSTASPTIADTNSCTTVAAPCRTIAGAIGKLPISTLGLISNTIAKMYLADAANTTTDCYPLTGVNLLFPTAGRMPEVIAEQAKSATFPSTYLYVYGNPTTPANAAVVGGSCGSTTVGSQFALSVENGVVRVNGVFLEGYGASAVGSLAGVLQAQAGAIVYGDNISHTGDGATRSITLSANGPTAMVRAGGTHTITNTGGWILARAGGSGIPWDGLASVSANTTLTYNSSMGGAVLNVQGGGYIWPDRLTYTLSGSGGYFFESAFPGVIYETEAFTPGTDCPALVNAGMSNQTGGCFFGTLNNANLIYQGAFGAGSFIDSDCLDYSEGSCVTTQQPAVHTQADTGGHAKEYPTQGGNIAKITAADNLGGGGCVDSFTGSAESEVCQQNGVRASIFDSNGTTFTASGCSITGLVGGGSVGRFASGTTGTCTVTITPTLPSGMSVAGFTCMGTDTNTGAFIGQSTTSATTCTISGSTTSGDVVRFLVMAYN